MPRREGTPSSAQQDSHARTFRKSPDAAKICRFPRHVHKRAMQTHLPHEPTLFGPSRFHRPARGAGRTEADRAAGIATARDDGDLRAAYCTAKVRRCSSSIRRTAHGNGRCRCWPISSARRNGSREAWARNRCRRLREVGKLLAYLKEPDPPRGLEGCLGQVAGAQAGAQHVAADRVAARRASTDRGGQRTWTSVSCRSRPAGPAMPGRSSPGAWSSPAARASRGRTSAFIASR